MRRFPKSVLPDSNCALAASAVVLLLGLALASRAAADVQVSVRVRLPHVSVDVNPPLPRCGMPPVRQVERVEIIITRGDRRTARLLARQFGCCQDSLLDLRQAGYSWHAIRDLLSRPPRLARVTSYPLRVHHLACGDRDDAHRDKKHHRSHRKGDCRD